MRAGSARSRGRRASAPTSSCTCRPTRVLSRATVIKVGELVGAAQVIVGEVSVDGDALTVRAQPIRIDVGRADSEVDRAGQAQPTCSPSSQKVGAPARPRRDRARRRCLRRRCRRSSNTSRGCWREQPASQATFLEAALKLDPRYDRARLALWEVRTAQGDHAAALAAARAVGRRLARRAPRAVSRRRLAARRCKQYDEAFDRVQGRCQRRRRPDPGAS